MDEETREKLKEYDKMLDDIYRSVEKTRRYFLWTLIITVALFILPLIGLIFVIPMFLNNYIGALTL